MTVIPGKRYQLEIPKSGKIDGHENDQFWVEKDGMVADDLRLRYFFLFFIR